ncbi:MAG: type II toxin-antitoxin system VapC family toxin [Geminicoccales bacterium]
MRVLLDTHAFLWWLAGDPSLSERARQVIREEGNTVLLSAASAWEIATKVRLGKLPGAARIAGDILGCLRDEGFEPLAVTVRHGQHAGALPGLHRDPFDRMLIAQAILESCVLVSNESRFDAYGVIRLW